MTHGLPVRLVLHGGAGRLLSQVAVHHLLPPGLRCFSTVALPAAASGRRTGPRNSLGSIAKFSSFNLGRKSVFSGSLGGQWQHCGSSTDRHPPLCLGPLHGGTLRAFSQSAGGDARPPEGVARRAWARVATLVKAFMSGTRILYKDIRRALELERRKGKLVLSGAAPAGPAIERGGKGFPFSREEVQFIYTVSLSSAV